jgi:hypothetical protein
MTQQVPAAARTEHRTPNSMGPYRPAVNSAGTPPLSRIALRSGHPLRADVPRSVAALRAQSRLPAGPPPGLGRAQRRCRSPGRSPPRSNDDCGVLARVVQIARAHNDPGAGVSLEEITGLEDQVGVPVLPMAVRIHDGECSRHFFSVPLPWRSGSGSGHGGTEAIGCSTLSVAREGTREYCPCPRRNQFPCPPRARAPRSAKVLVFNHPGAARNSARPLRNS